MSLNECPKCREIVKPSEFFCPRCGAPIPSPQKTSIQHDRKRVTELRGYIQIIGTVEIVFGIIGLFIGLIAGLFAAFIPILITEETYIESPNDFGDFDPEMLGGFLAIFIGIVALAIFAFSIAAVISGMKVIQFKNSGRIGTMIIAVFSLAMIPLGTAFGVVALYILTRPEAESLFI